VANIKRLDVLFEGIPSLFIAYNHALDDKVEYSKCPSLIYREALEVGLNFSLKS
jgi:hypothetical protein